MQHIFCLLIEIFKVSEAYVYANDKKMCKQSVPKLVDGALNEWRVIKERK